MARADSRRSLLTRAFYARPTPEVARELLGARLVRMDRGRRLSGIIVETEAYEGAQDLGSHARAGLTQRNWAMFGPPGRVYVYFSYGNHWMLNFVTGPDGVPGAVLIRAVLPQDGIALMRRRRHRPDAELANGPGKLCQAFGIDARHYGLDLCDPAGPITVERASLFSDVDVTTGPRVGLYTVPEPWKSRPWRFHVRGAGRRVHG